MVRLVTALLIAAGCGRISFEEGSAVDSNVAPPPPWATPQVFVDFNGDDPSPSPDWLELYCNVMSNEVERTSRASTTDVWPVPSIIAELDVAASQAGPEVTADGLTMYFASARPGGLGMKDIWVTTRAARTDPWGTPTHVPELSSATGDHAGNMSPDGLTMVFDSNRLGDDDLYIATRAATTDPWTTPVALTSLNTAGFIDESPSITSDGLEIYFDSNRAGVINLYVARRATLADAFGAPEALDYLATGSPMSDPWISPDGHDLVFFSVGKIWRSTR